MALMRGRIEYFKNVLQLINNCFSLLLARLDTLVDQTPEQVVGLFVVKLGESGLNASPYCSHNCFTAATLSPVGLD
jgi:hypothetical protein